MTKIMLRIQGLFEDSARWVEYIDEMKDHGIIVAEDRPDGRFLKVIPPYEVTNSLVIEHSKG